MFLSAGSGTDRLRFFPCAPFFRPLVQHTWGLPTLYDTSNYTNAEFHAARDAGLATYANSEASWQEQRDVGAVYAMQALRDHPLAAQVVLVFVFRTGVTDLHDLAVVCTAH